MQTRVLVVAVFTALNLGLLIYSPSVLAQSSDPQSKPNRSTLTAVPPAEKGERRPASPGEIPPSPVEKPDAEKPKPDREQQEIAPAENGED